MILDFVTPLFLVDLYFVLSNPMLYLYLFRFLHATDFIKSDDFVPYHLACYPMRYPWDHRSTSAYEGPAW